MKSKGIPFGMKCKAKAIPFSKRNLSKKASRVKNTFQKIVKQFNYGRRKETISLDKLMTFSWKIKFFNRNNLIHFLYIMINYLLKMTFHFLEQAKITFFNPSCFIMFGVSRG
jgi:preprotein translocase subunit SecA